MNRFDGMSFTSFRKDKTANEAFPEWHVWSLVPLEEDGLLIGSTNGLTYYNKELSTFHTVEAISPSATVYAICKLGEELLIGTNKGLYRGKKSSANQFKFNLVEGTDVLEIRAIHRTSWGDTYIGAKNGLFKFHDNRLHRSKIKNTHAPQIRQIESDSRGTWVATFSQGLHLLGETGTTLKSYTHGSSNNQNGLSGSELRTIMIDQLSNIWIGTEDGITILESAGKTRHIRNSQSASNPSSEKLVLRVFEDQSGLVWVGTLGGIKKYNPISNKFPMYSRYSTALPGLENDSIMTFKESADGTLWIATYDGIAKWRQDSNNIAHYKAKNLGLTGSRVTTISETESLLYLGTMRGGLHVLRKSDLSIQKTHSINSHNQERRIPSNAISKTLFAKDGTKWIGTYGEGVFILDKYGIKTTTISGIDFPTGKVLSIAEAVDGKIWIAADGNGISIIDPTLGSIKRIQHLANDPNTISSNKISQISFLHDSAWIGTLSKGLNRYDLNTGQVTRLTVDDGLSSNIVYGLELDSENNIWISGAKGLTRLNPETNTFTNFNTSHGLQGDDFNHGASLAMSNGTLLFGGNNGFNAFKPAEVKLNDHMGNMLITKFNKFNRVVNPGEALNAETTLELTHEENVFGFEYALMDFASAKDNTYDYRMVGFDKDWVDAGSSRSATYTNLDAGHYRFEVRGRNNDGLLSDKIASVNVYVAPAPWRTWYAYTFYCLLALAIFFVAFRTYTREVIRRTNEKRNQEEKKRLEELVTIRTVELNEKVLEQARTLEQKDLANKEIHHRVKNNLQVILGLLTLQAESEENEKFQEAMNQIRQRVTSMSLIHKSLYEHSVASIDFRQYVENLISSIRQFHPALANGEICIHLDLANIVLDIDTALPLGLILNELVTNSIKHGFDKGRTANPQIIEISCQQVEDACVMAVTDNGLGLPDGFDIESPTSMGSELILIFTQQLQGSINAQNKQDGGSIFQLSFPMKSARESNA